MVHSKAGHVKRQDKTEWTAQYAGQGAECGRTTVITLIKTLSVASLIMSKKQQPQK